ncbi:MAG: ABC transporter permease, partial [Phocaeicola faecicola]|nr:ABC transporter permease [Phocaeicola faecicola]
FSFFLIRKGMLWGNIVALVLCLVQYLFQPFRLDESIYYIPYVPIELNLGIWLLLNVCTLIISVCVLVAPSYLISRIHPVKSIRFE